MRGAGARIGGVLSRRVICSLTSLFGVFSSSAELGVLYSLFRNSLGIARVATTAKISRATISRRLQVLGRGRLIGCAERNGRIICSLSSSRIGGVVSYKVRRVRR